MANDAVEPLAASRPRVLPAYITDNTTTSAPVSMPAAPQPTVTSAAPSLAQIGASLNRLGTALANPATLTRADLRKASFLLNDAQRSLQAQQSQTPAGDTDTQQQIQQLQALLQTLLTAVRNLMRASSANSASTDGSSTSSGDANTSTDSSGGSDSGNGVVQNIADAALPGLGTGLRAAESIPVVGNIVKGGENLVTGVLKHVPILGGLFK